MACTLCRRCAGTRGVPDGERSPDRTQQETEAAAELLRSTNPRARVGTRHHVVSRFLLGRWADARCQVRVYTRVDERFSLRNIKDLAVEDFHTFIDLDGKPNSLPESLLGEVEAPAAAITLRLIGGLSGQVTLTDAELATLALFASFQVARTPRRRRPRWS